jgi:hypothetical protein
MSNRPNPPKRYAWQDQAESILGMGMIARAAAADRRLVEDAAREEGKRPERPYSPGRAEKESMKSRYPKR